MNKDKNVKPLEITFGQEENGKELTMSLLDTKNIYITGGVGTGKSNLMHRIIRQLLEEKVEKQIVLIDGKMVEFASYARLNGIEFLNSKEKITTRLTAILDEIKKRKDLLLSNGKTDLQTYNDSKSEKESLPYIILIIDEIGAINYIRPIISKLTNLLSAGNDVGVYTIANSQNCFKELNKYFETKIAAVSYYTKDIATFLGQKKLKETKLGEMYLTSSCDKSLKKIFVPYFDYEKFLQESKFLMLPPKDKPIEVEQEPQPIKDDEIMPILQKISTRHGMDALIRDIENNEPFSASRLQRYLLIGFHDAAMVVDYLVQIGALSEPDKETRIRSYINRKLVVDTLNNNK